jgi:prepilin-type N-terminal cleavage/methylation domain-containing protein
MEMRTMNVLRSEKGLGLVEIIIAMLIFGIGITAALRAIPTSNAAASRSRNLTVCTNLAEEKLEQLMGAPYTNADLAAGTHVDPDNPLQIHYNRQWVVIDDSPMEDMKTVTVTVTYDGKSKDNSSTLTTYITSRR